MSRTFKVGDELSQTRKKLREARARVKAMEEVLADLTDSGSCSYDHNGHCQAHLWFSGEIACPHKRAKELLGW